MKRNQTNRASALALESLEQRRLLSGAVTVSLTTDGTLTLKGDAGCNNLTIDGSTGAYVITGNTTGIFAGAFGVGSSATVPAAAVMRIKIELGDGNDGASIVECLTANGTRIRDSVTITDDKGNDFYALFDDEIAQKVTIKTGAGFDQIQMFDAGNGFSAGATSIDSGGDASTDFVTLQQVNLGVTSITTGGGNDSVQVAFGNNIAQLNITTGDGNDGVFLGFGAGDNYNALTVDTGKGDDSLSMGNVNVGAFAPGTFSIKMGDGFDTFSAQNVIVFTGAGIADGGEKVDIFQDNGGNFGFTLVKFEVII